MPEKKIEDYNVAGMGYGTSKMVSENLLAEAAKHGVGATVLRVGQVSGPVATAGGKGMWNKQEWLPTASLP